jgi:hypothetical protein
MEEWDSQFPRSRWEESVYRLGNLTLLSASANRTVGNSTYAEKLGAYAHSAYVITQRVAENAPDQWTPEHLDVRQREMASRAVHIWKADFA